MEAYPVAAPQGLTEKLNVNLIASREPDHRLPVKIIMDLPGACQRALISTCRSVTYLVIDPVKTGLNRIHRTRPGPASTSSLCSTARSSFSLLFIIPSLPCLLPLLSPFLSLLCFSSTIPSPLRFFRRRVCRSTRARCTQVARALEETRSREFKTMKGAEGRDGRVGVKGPDRERDPAGPSALFSVAETAAYASARAHIPGAVERYSEPTRQQTRCPVSLGKPSIPKILMRPAPFLHSYRFSGVRPRFETNRHAVIFP